MKKKRALTFIICISFLTVSNCSPKKAVADSLTSLAATELMVSSKSTEITSSFELSSQKSPCSNSTNLYSSNVDLLTDERSELVFSNPNSYTQGMCSYDEGIFISQRNDGDYYLSRVSFMGDKNIVNSPITYNHANGLAYNPYKNELYVCKLSSSSGTDGCDLSCDYSFYVVDADTFEIKNTVNLYNIIIDVCSDSLGMSGIAFNKQYNKIYILTRKPKRYIVELDADFSFSRFIFLCEYQPNTVFGDICSFNDYIVTSYWDSEAFFTNVVTFYDLFGNFLREVRLNGVTHIESIDEHNGRLIANFNDFVDGNSTKVYSVDIL